MTRLTDLVIRNLKTKTERMVADGEGLYLRLRPNSGQKHWIYRFTQGGKTQKMQIGIYVGDCTLIIRALFFNEAHLEIFRSSCLLSIPRGLQHHSAPTLISAEVCR
jgi:hypothetical protein